VLNGVKILSIVNSIVPVASIVETTGFIMILPLLLRAHVGVASMSPETLAQLGGDLA